MTVIQEIAAIVGALALISYPLIMIGLARWVHTTRLRMAELSKVLIDSPHLQPNRKKMVARMATDAFSAMHMVVASIAMPLAIASTLRGAKSPFDPVQDEEARELLYEFTACYIRSAAAANPIFAAIVTVEFVILTPVFWKAKETLNDIKIRAVSRGEDMMYRGPFSPVT